VRKDAQFGCSRDAGFAGAAARKRCGVDLTARQTIGSRSAPRISRESAIQTHGQAIRSTRRATLRPKKERSLYKRLPDNLP